MQRLSGNEARRVAALLGAPTRLRRVVCLIRALCCAGLESGCAWCWLHSVGRGPRSLIAALGLCGIVFGRPDVSQAGINVWTSHGPYGGNVSALAIDPTTPSTLYVGTYEGVFQSTNSGTNWGAVNTGLSGNAFLALALTINPTTPSTLYVGTYEGVFQSTNAAPTGARSTPA